MALYGSCLRNLHRNNLISEGYSEGFKIKSVSAFEATDIHYGAFIELFDCYYEGSFGGSSGGPLVNQKRMVEGVFTYIHNNTNLTLLW